MPTRNSSRGTGRSPGWFANRPVSVKIATAVLIVAAVAVAVGVTALLKMSTINANGRAVYDQNLVPISDLERVEYGIEEAKVDTAQYVLNMDRPAKQPERIQNLKDDDAAVDQALAAYLTGDTAGREKQIAALKAALAKYRQLRTAEMAAAMSGGLAAYHPVHSDAADASDAANAAVSALITFTTLPISAEESPSLATVAVVVAAAVTALLATSLASAALLAISRMLAPICSAPAATVCTLRDTSSAADDTTPDCAEVSSAEAEICAEDADSSSDDAATASAERTTVARTSRRFSRAASSDSAMRPTSSRWVTPLGLVRSPSASRASDSRTRPSGRVISCATYRAAPRPASRPATSTTMTIVRAVL